MLLKVLKKYEKMLHIINHLIVTNTNYTIHWLLYVLVTKVVQWFICKCFSCTKLMHFIKDFLQTWKTHPKLNNENWEIWFDFYNNTIHYSASFHSVIYSFIHLNATRLLCYSKLNAL